MECDILLVTVNNIYESFGVANGSMRFDFLKHTKCKHDGDLTVTCDNILKRFSTLKNKFPTDLKAWKHEIHVEEKVCPICAELKILIDKSKTWPLLIERFQIKDNYLVLSFERTSAFQSVLRSVLSQQLNYGVVYSNEKVLSIESSCPNVVDEIKDLSELRLFYLKQCLANIARAAGYSIINKRQSEDDIGIFLTTNSGVNTTFDVKTIVCGVVTNAESGSKETKLEFKEYLSHRVNNMKTMSVHKYGDSITDDASWNDLLNNLADAAVKMELLSVKPTQTVIAKLEAHCSVCKGATFILYNYARISSIMQQFHGKEVEQVYPALPSLESVDFSLLIDQEEWELLYFIMVYPSVIVNCMRDVEKGVVKPHFICTFLCKLCKTFSTYYRRIRILREPRPHMIPTVFARIYLLKGIQNVMYNALALLGIEPVRQM